MCASCSSLLDGMDDSATPHPEAGRGEPGSEPESSASGESEEPDSKESILAGGEMKKKG